MTYLPATVIGRWFHLYLILDLYSRKVVGWEVHATDDSHHAAQLVQRTALGEGIAMLAMLYELGVKPSYARPRVSDDNAYAESLFRTAKYHHSGIGYVSPAQRHAGEDHAILAARHELYMRAREANPARWSGSTRDWAPLGPVTLNQERDSIVTANSTAVDKQLLAA